MPITLEDRARNVIQHYCDRLGLTPAEFARAEGLDPERITHFQQGSIAALSESEAATLGTVTAALLEGEQWEVWEAKRKFLTPPSTAVDAWKMEKTNNG